MAETERVIGDVNGKSDYDIAVDLGFTGTVEDWTNSLSELIDREIVDKMNAHIEANNNPHIVDNTDIGLNNVSNYQAISTNNSVSNTQYSTPLSTKLEIDSLLNTIRDNLTSNATNFDNIKKDVNAADVKVGLINAGLNESSAIINAAHEITIR